MIETRQLAPDSRKHHRVCVPMRVELDGARLDIVDWSPGGLRVAAVPARLLAMGGGSVRVSLPTEGVPFVFDAAVRVVRVGEGEAGLRFEDLPASIGERLYTFGRGAPPAAPSVGAPGEGEPGGSSRVAPATAPRAPTPEKVAVPQGPWRPPLRSVVYVVIGTLLAIYIVHALYERVWRIQVDTASLIAPMAQIVSPADGVVEELRVSLGERVAEGDRLFLVAAPAVRNALERSALEVGLAEVRVAELEAARAAQEDRLSIHARMMRSRVAAQRALVSHLRDRLAMADAHVARIEALEGGGVSAFEVDAVRSDRAALAGELELASSYLTTEAGRLGAARHGYYFDGDRIPDGLPEIEAALTAARADLALRVARLEAEQADAVLAQAGEAPFAGRVAGVAQTAGTPVREGSLVVVLEKETDGQVEAWLTREEAEYVRLGDPARVSVAGVGRVYDAVVRSIDSDAAASARRAEAGDVPRLRVLLELQGYAGEPDTGPAALSELREVDAVGLPAVVNLARSWR